ncbi:MAG: aminoacyl-tRNA hydrolase [Desulfobacterium sp.]|jgi:PTH1 family peptidyl-tRNA hydrolase|nr:aminoacyl-tRNA hydrolase [Desulfobacterium sp.]
MADNQIFMVAGLGNPGREYAQTRHNIGFFVAQALITTHRFPPEKNRPNTAYTKGLINGFNVVIARPQAYMNRSGPPLQQLAAYFKILPSNIIVVHDDLDLVFGRLLVAFNRGHGGHNGIRSTIEALGTKEFNRVRIGVGRPHGGQGVTGHVLGRFSPSEVAELAKVVDQGAEACEAIIQRGVTAAMNLYNTRE